MQMVNMVYLIAILTLSAAATIFAESPDNPEIIKTDMAIVGGGPAGLSAAIGAGKAGLNPIVIEGTILEGAANKAGYISNYPGIAKATGSELIQNMREQAKNLNVRLLPEEKVISYNLKSHPFRLETNKGKIIDGNCLIIATGTNPAKLDIPGEDKFLGKGVAYCSKCDGPLFKGKKVIIVGDDHSALRELAILKDYTNDIVLITEKDHFDAPQMLLDNLKTPNLKIHKNSKAKEILGDTKVTGINVQFQNGEMEVFPTDGVFIAKGWQPATEYFKDQLKLNDKGEIVVDNDTWETSILGIFACGDCSSKSRHQFPVAAGAGSDAYLSAEKYVKKLRKQSC